MAFSEKELEQIEKHVDGLCSHRVPDHAKDQVRMGYSIEGHNVLIYESRPGWRNPSEWTKLDVAKLKYVRARDEWRLYWMRASGKWWLYEPYSSSKTLASMVKKVDLDPHGCFFG